MVSKSARALFSPNNFTTTRFMPFFLVYLSLHQAIAIAPVFPLAFAHTRAMPLCAFVSKKKKWMLRHDPMYVCIYVCMNACGMAWKHEHG